MVKCFLSVSKNALPTSTVFPFSRSKKEKNWIVIMTLYFPSRHEVVHNGIEKPLIQEKIFFRADLNPLILKCDLAFYPRQNGQS